MKTLTVAGKDLYRVALEQYGDATQAFRIGQANGLIDPVLTGVNTLIIPDKGATGGVYGS